MKFLILASAVAVTLSSVATASERIVGLELVGTPMPAHAPQGSVAAIKLAMGPTSAPQKPGGVGEGSNETPKPHKTPKHKHQAT